MVMPTNVRREDLPGCFGKDWDAGAAECAGGADAGYVHPTTKQNVRDRCNYFSSCGARTQASKQAAGSTVIPPSHLVRPPVVTPPPAETFADYLRKRNSEYAESMRQAAFTQQQPQPGVVPRTVPVVGQPQPQPQVVVAHHPGQVYHLNYTMPGYLSTPEERFPGESLGAVLLRELIRSVLKAAGHAIAHFFDSRRIKEKNGPSNP
jgi:hypothetical protein